MICFCCQTTPFGIMYGDGIVRCEARTKVDKVYVKIADGSNKFCGLRISWDMRLD